MQHAEKKKIQTMLIEFAAKQTRCARALDLTARFPRVDSRRRSPKICALLKGTIDSGNHRKHSNASWHMREKR